MPERGNACGSWRRALGILLYRSLLRSFERSLELDVDHQAAETLLILLLTVLG